MSNTDLKNMQEQVNEVKEQAQVIATYIKAIAKMIASLHAEDDGEWESSSGFSVKWRQSGHMLAVAPTHTHWWVWFNPHNTPANKPALWLEIGAAFNEEVAREVRELIEERAKRSKEVRQQLQKAASILA